MQEKLLIFGGIFVGLLIIFNQTLTLNSRTVPSTLPTAPTNIPTISPNPTTSHYIYPTTTGTGLSNDNYYINSNGSEFHSPAYSNIVPSGATAKCLDETYSFSQHRSGTCSHHGGVVEWL